MQERQTFNPPATTPLATFLVQAAALAVAAVVLSVLLGPAVHWVLFAFCIASLAVGQSLANGDYPHQSFGLCNTVTLLRAMLVSLLFGTLFAADAVSPWLVFGIGAVALLLDGVDGWLARRSGLLSGFGARFDVETDAALAAVLSLWLIVSGTTGLEILILGFARYAFVAAGWVMPRLSAELSPSFRRKAICVLQIGTLILLTVPIVPGAMVVTLSVTASAVLCYSFALDVAWLLRRPAT